MKGTIGNPSWWNNIPTEFKIDRCYHTTWQSVSGMRFILIKVEGTRALLKTKASNKTYWTNLSELRNTNTHK